MPKKYFLGVLTYFKNERNIIHEWILHYKKWGIDHIWLIDNGSKDNYDISNYINDGLVTLYKEPSLGQREAYNKYLPRIKKNVVWLGVFDMDEFLFSKEDDDLKCIIKKKIAKNTSLISIQMTIFLPCTFLSSKSVIETNILRKNYDSNKHPKCLYNLNRLNRVTIHGYKPSIGKHTFISANKKLLCINHYRYNSFEYLYGIKEGRGGGVSKKKYKTFIS